LAANLDVEISLNGNPIKDIISPMYKNQKEYLINKATSDPTNVRQHPNKNYI
jgi:hypothetical protein